MSSELELRDRRREEIRQILHRQSVTSQGEIVEALRLAGFEVTQSSVSRDLTELGVAKVGGRYQLLSRELEAPALDALQLAARFLRDARPAGPHLTVLRTMAGTAQTVAAALDQAGWAEIVGTVAGDDTLFVATDALPDQKRLLHRLQVLMKETSHG